MGRRTNAQIAVDDANLTAQIDSLLGRRPAATARASRRVRAVVVYTKPGHIYLHARRFTDGKPGPTEVMFVIDGRTVFSGLADAPAETRNRFAGAVRAKLVPRI